MVEGTYSFVITAPYYEPATITADLSLEGDCCEFAALTPNDAVLDPHMTLANPSSPVP